MTHIELMTALAAAKGGEVISLPPGDYGDVEIIDRKPAVPITLRSADPKDPARFRTLLLDACDGLILEGLAVAFTPTSMTVAHSSAVMLRRCGRIVVRGCKVLGDVNGAVTGIAATTSPDAARPDASVLGLPIGRAITVERCDDVRIERNDIARFLRGVTLTNSSNVQIIDNDIHHIRTSPILGAAWPVKITGNWLHSNCPWNYGGNGDHGGFIRLWLEAGQPAMVGVVIADNLLDQGSGPPVVAVHLQDKAAAGLPSNGYRNLTIAGNVTLNGSTQAYTLENCHGVLTDCLMLQTEGTVKQGPSLLFKEGTAMAVERNTLTDVGDMVKNQVPPSTYLDNVLISRGPRPATEIIAAREAWLAGHRAPDLATLLAAADREIGSLTNALETALERLSTAETDLAAERQAMAAERLRNAALVKCLGVLAEGVTAALKEIDPSMAAAA